MSDGVDLPSHPSSQGTDGRKSCESHLPRLPAELVALILDRCLVTTAIHVCAASHEMAQLGGRALSMLCRAVADSLAVPMGADGPRFLNGAIMRAVVRDDVRLIQGIILADVAYVRPMPRPACTNVAGLMGAAVKSRTLLHRYQTLTVDECAAAEIDPHILPYLSMGPPGRRFVNVVDLAALAGSPDVLRFFAGVGMRSGRCHWRLVLAVLDCAATRAPAPDGRARPTGDVLRVISDRACSSREPQPLRAHWAPLMALVHNAQAIATAPWHSGTAGASVASIASSLDMAPWHLARFVDNAVAGLGYGGHDDAADVKDDALRRLVVSAYDLDLGRSVAAIVDHDGRGADAQIICGWPGSASVRDAVILSAGRHDQRPVWTGASATRSKGDMWTWGHWAACGRAACVAQDALAWLIVAFADRLCAHRRMAEKSAGHRSSDQGRAKKMRVS